MIPPPPGIVKTHRLTLQTPSSQLHLHVPEAVNESHVVIGPRAMRDMIDHFPSTRGRADPQLIWVFDDKACKLVHRTAGHRVDYQRGGVREL